LDWPFAGCQTAATAHAVTVVDPLQVVDLAESTLDLVRQYAPRLRSGTLHGHLNPTRFAETPQNAPPLRLV
jgi:hypothetical protein